MADRSYSDPEKMYTYETDGGEAEPRPLKARRLLDVMEGQGKSPRRDSLQGKLSREDVPENPRESSPPPRRARSLDPVYELSPGACTILSVTPSGEGETVTVVMTMPDPSDGKTKKLRFHLLVEQYAELGVQTGEITLDTAATLLDAGQLCTAIRRGMVMLGYGDQSARRLAYKLTAKGVDREMASRAVAYLTERGYIREENTATLRARQGVNKGWGERRIREDLFALGFTREAVEEAMDDLSDVDWEENCAASIRKKYRVMPEERGEWQKLVAAMVRLGYDADTVKSALRRMMRQG